MKVLFVLCLLISMETVAGEPLEQPEPRRQPIIDLFHYQDATKQQAERYIGQPLFCEKSKYGLRCKYNRNGTEIEIVYINGKADWITIYLDGLRQDSETLRLIGLPPQPPSFQNEHVIRWEGMIDSGRKLDGAILMMLVTEIIIHPNLIYIQMHTRS